jgi:hypothetical protein
MRHIALASMDHADDCLICSRERKAAMRSLGPTADRGPFCSAIGPKRGLPMMLNFGADVGSTAQYFCKETRTDENKESPPIGFALEAGNPGDVGLLPRETSPEDINVNNFIRPQRFSCKGSDTEPAAYSTYRYDRGKTFSFKLDNAMAIIVEDDKTNEIAIDTWFMRRYTKHK